MVGEHIPVLISSTAEIPQTKRRYKASLSHEFSMFSQKGGVDFVLQDLIHLPELKL